MGEDLKHNRFLSMRKSTRFPKLVGLIDADAADCRLPFSGLLVHLSDRNHYQLDWQYLSVHPV